MTTPEESAPDAPVSARRLASGAAWTYGSQLVAVVAQFGYAAVTSRLVDPRSFGVYAITLAITALVTLIATGGLGQTIGRMHEVVPATVRALCTLALLLGLASAAALGLGAPLWAALWSTPSASSAVAVMAISAFVAPFYGLVTGLVRRLGLFRLLAAQQLVGTLLGMVLGVVSVVLFRSAESLLVSPIAGSLLTTLFCAWSARRYLGLGRIRSAVGELAFSAQLTLASLLSYGVGNVSRIVATNVLGASALGYWNRAEVVSIIPFQQLQTALIQTIYPEFRHDREGSERARRVWTDLLVVMGAVLMAVAVIGSIAVPPLVLILLGPQWEVARQLVPLLMFAGAVQAVGTVLAAAIEAIGRFRWVWTTQIVLLVLQIGIAASIVLTHSLVITVAGVLLTSIARQVWQGVVCSRAGYLDGRRLLRSSIITTVVAVGLYGVLAGALQVVGPTLPATVACLLVVLVTAVLLRRPLSRLPVIALIGRYGLLPGRQRN
ncbi:oligosaccharide flippase family protein [Amnibacterium endophyticum]|uniref:Oligosaccharide flippase family protein n=1 Tax=Amnibacterium endophyticum TaxID=2109337 RepID=A0ABW4LAZ7_9MICO